MAFHPYPKGPPESPEVNKMPNRSSKYALAIMDITGNDAMRLTFIKRQQH